MNITFFKLKKDIIFEDERVAIVSHDFRFTKIHF